MPHFSTQKYSILFSSFLFFIFLSACTRDKAPVIVSECDEEITYIQHIQPLLANNCNLSGCHDSNSSNGDFTSYDDISKFFGKNKLYNRTVTQRNMPPVDPLSDEDLNLLICWIEGEYQED